MDGGGARVRALDDLGRPRRGTENHGPVGFVRELALCCPHDQGNLGLHRYTARRVDAVLGDRAEQLQQRSEHQRLTRAVAADLGTSDVQVGGEAGVRQPEEELPARSRRTSSGSARDASTDSTAERWCTTWIAVYGSLSAGDSARSAISTICRNPKRMSCCRVRSNPMCT